MYDNQIRGSLIGLEHTSALLKGNPLGDPHVRTFPVYLPPAAIIDWLLRIENDGTRPYLYKWK